jgi:hypothetical protein
LSWGRLVVSPSVLVGEGNGDQNGQVVVDGASDCIYLAYDETVTAIEWLVCKFFPPKTDIVSTVTEFRWWLFEKKQAQSERLPSTFAALY